MLCEQSSSQSNDWKLFNKFKQPIKTFGQQPCYPGMIGQLSSTFFPLITDVYEQKNKLKLKLKHSFYTVS